MNKSSDGSVPEAFSSPVWPRQVHRIFSDHRIRQVCHVPDAGHRELMDLCRRDPEIQSVPLTTEEEGVGLAMGAWLGGSRSVLLLQSSGVGNLINVLGALRECRFPFLMLVTMRGEEGEANPWQVPMGRATPTVLEAMGVEVVRAESEGEVAPALEDLAQRVFREEIQVALLLSQRLLGAKSFREEGGGE